MSGTTRFPNLIIGGAPKSGTSFIFKYLSKHPDISHSKRKETRYFQPLARGEELEPLENYLKFFENHKGQKFIMEASPGYLYGGTRISETIKDLLGEIKVIFILREPVSRFVSHYKHLIKHMEISKDSFSDFMKSAFEIYNQEAPVFEKEKSNYYKGIRAGCYLQYLKDWYETFPEDNIKIFYFDDIIKQPEKVLTSICNWLEISENVYSSIYFEPENQSFEYNSKLMHREALKISTFLRTNLKAFEPIRILLRKIYRLINKQKAGTVISENEKITLNQFYKKQNQGLKEFLSSKGYNLSPYWME